MSVSAMFTVFIYFLPKLQEDFAEKVPPPRRGHQEGGMGVHFHRPDSRRPRDSCSGAINEESYAINT